MGESGIEFPWAGLLGGLIGGWLCDLLIKRFVNRPTQEPGDVIVVRAPASMKAVMGFGVLFFGAFVPLIIINPGDEMGGALRWILGAFFSGATIFYGVATVDAVTRVAVWDGRRLRYRRGFGRHGDRDAGEIVDLRWRPALTHWRIGFSDGKGLGVPAVGAVTPYFIQAVADHLGVEPKGLDDWYPKFEAKRLSAKNS